MPDERPAEDSSTAKTTDKTTDDHDAAADATDATDVEATDVEATDVGASASSGVKPANSPSPRPRSAASRARRIGGAATPAPTESSAERAAAGSAKPSTGKADAGKADAGKADIGKADTGKSDTGKARTGKVVPGKTAKPGASKSGSKLALSKSAADEAADEELDTTDGEGRRSKRFVVALPGWSVWTPTVLFAAAAVVFLTLFLVARLGDDSDTTSSKTRQEVLAAAKTCLATLNTYRYDKIDAAEAAGVKCTTAKLTSDYRKTVTSVIRVKAPPLKAVQLAKINSAGIESVTKNGKQWTVLAYGQLNITTSQQKQGRVDPFAVVARLQQVGGKWVLSKIDPVSSFTS